LAFSALHFTIFIMMRKLFVYIGLFLAVYASRVAAQPAWMNDNAAILGKLQLNQIALPGTHDAGSFGIIPPKKSGIFGPKVETSPDTKPLKQILARGSVFTDWAKTQERTTIEMLNDGIRYFDIRVCVDGKGMLMTCHGVYGASVESMLNDIKLFSDKNPKELILIGFNHFWDRQFQIEQNRKQGEIEGLRKTKWAELVGLIKTKLAGKLVDGKKFSPKSKLEDLWKLKKDNQVIVLFDSDEVQNDVLIWNRKEENTWFAGWDIDAFKSNTISILQNAKDGKYADKFYAIRSSVTPDENGKLISLGFFNDLYPSSASELADMTNPIALGWIKNDWAGKYPINLIWADFYNRHDLVKLAKKLNGIKVDFANTKIGTDTNWTRWKKTGSSTK
jgi:hypothetical protein